MATDFSYNDQTVKMTGPIRPGINNVPGDARTRVETYAEISSIPNPYVGMVITVLKDEYNDNKMTDYKVISLKANNLGIQDTVIDKVKLYTEYLGISIKEGPTGPTGPTGPAGRGLQGFPGATGPMGEQGPKGDRGPAGTVFTPNVDEEGNLSWTNDGGLENPSTINIKGSQGDRGLKGEQGPTGEQGEKGEQGPIGPIGPTGSQGAQGPTGPAGKDGTGVSIQGSFDSKDQLPTEGNVNGIAYLIAGDMWLYNGNSTEDDTHHSGFANIGKIQGPIGPTGPTGAVFNPNVDEAGNLSWTNDGGLENPSTVNIKGPQGEKGDKGDPFTYVDFTPEQLEALKGEKGDKGDPGQDGAQGEKGDKGDPFTYVDFTPEQLEALKGEKGDKGDPGQDGAQGEKGDKGDAFTYDDFTPEQLESLKGEKGEPGQDGAKGEKGEPGQDGAKGEKGEPGNTPENPNFTIGTVTKLEAGADPTVTITGNYPNFVLNFGIPVGSGSDTPPVAKEYIYWGRLSIAEVGGSIIDYNQITEDTILNGDNINKVEPTTMGKTSAGLASDTAKYDYVIIAVPVSKGYKVTKDDGIGGKSPFTTDGARIPDIATGANDVRLNIAGVDYALYGEVLLAQGELFFYID